MLEIIIAVVVGAVVLGILVLIGLAIYRSHHPAGYTEHLAALSAAIGKLNPQVGAELSAALGHIPTLPTGVTAAPPVAADANTAATAANTQAIAANTEATAALAATVAPPPGSSAGTAAGADHVAVLGAVTTLVQALIPATTLPANVSANLFTSPPFVSDADQARLAPIYAAAGLFALAYAPRIIVVPPTNADGTTDPANIDAVLSKYGTHAFPVPDLTGRAYYDNAGRIGLVTAKA